MSKQLQENLRKLRNISGQLNPDQSWVSQNRKNLLSQISNTVDKEIKHSTLSRKIDEFLRVFVPKELVYATRPLIVAMLALTMTASGWVVGVSASDRSLPGEALYSLKLVAEKTEVTLAAITSDDSAVSKLHIKYAEIRSKEVKNLMQKNQDDSTELAEETIVKLKKSIEKSNKKVKAVSEKDTAKAVILAKDISKKTAEIAENLQDAAKISKDNTKEDVVIAETLEEETKISDKESSKEKTKKQEKKQQDDKEEAIEVIKADIALVKEMGETKKIATEMGLNVLKTVLEDATLEGADVISETDKKDIAVLVTEKIEVLVEEIKEIQDEAKIELSESVEDLSEKIDEKEILEEVKLDKKTNTSSTIKSEIKSEEKKDEDINKDDYKFEEVIDVEDLKETVKELAEETADATEILEEAKELVTIEQIIEAIDKTKEINIVQKEVAEKVIEAIQDVKELAIEEGIDTDDNAKEEIIINTNDSDITTTSSSPKVIDEVVTEE